MINKLSLYCFATLVVLSTFNTILYAEEIPLDKFLEKLETIESRIKVLEKATFNNTTSGQANNLSLDDYQSIIAKQSIQIAELQNAAAERVTDLMLSNKEERIRERARLFEELRPRLIREDGKPDTAVSRELRECLNDISRELDPKHINVDARQQTLVVRSYGDIDPALIQ